MAGGDATALARLREVIGLLGAAQDGSYQRERAMALVLLTKSEEWLVELEKKMVTP